MKNVFYLIVPQTPSNHSTGFFIKKFKPPKKGKNNLLVKKKKKKKKVSFCTLSTTAEGVRIFKAKPN